jgi:hypothetical protein
MNKSIHSCHGKGGVEDFLSEEFREVDGRGFTVFVLKPEAALD